MTIEGTSFSALLSPEGVKELGGGRVVVTLFRHPGRTRAAVNRFQL
jgi:hypothetical protein